jgi:hypothetical protein
LNRHEREVEELSKPGGTSRKMPHYAYIRPKQPQPVTTTLESLTTAVVLLHSPLVKGEL